MNDTVTVTVKIEYTLGVPMEDVQCLIEMAGYGISYWASKAVDDPEARTYTVTGEDPEKDGNVTKMLSYQDLADTLVKLGTRQVPEVSYMFSEHAEQYLNSLIAGDPDAGIFDSELADVVVQLSMFGEVVYG